MELWAIRKMEKLEADNARLRTELNAALDALREAPDPIPPGPVLHGDCYCIQGKYEDWYNGWRQRALGLAEVE